MLALRTIRPLVALALFGALAASTLTFGACGNSTCTSACAAWQKDCGLYPGADCNTICDQMESAASAAKCSGEFDDLTDCVVIDNYVCADGDTACQAETAAFSVCVQTYCIQRTDDPGCADIFFPPKATP
ncbi:MAG TPA: hypothetical protein VH560_15685 [Polyangia bacterium]|nr:hypothetical protein [Polyangia bacterium]